MLAAVMIAAPAAGRRRSRVLWFLAGGVAATLLLCAGAAVLIVVKVVNGCQRVDLTVPRPDGVRMGVFDRSGHPGRELDVFVALGQRGFQMLESGYGGANHPGAAVIVFGPKTVGAAQVVRAQLAEAEMRYEPRRRSDRVYLILGEQFTYLLSEADAEHRLTELGQPQAPPGAC